MNLRDKIEKIAILPDGVDVLGVASIDKFLELPERKRPDHLLPGAKSVVVLGSQVFRVLAERLTAQKKVGEVSHRDFYEAHNETVVHDLKQTGYRIARYLTNQGYQSINVGQDLTDYRYISGAFSFKYAALQAGLGTIGKNGLLISPDHGARLKLTAIITEATLVTNELLLETPCQECNICIKVCPSGALLEPEVNQQFNLNRFVCCSFYTANEGCSLCMSHCPR